MMMSKEEVTRLARSVFPDAQVELDDEGKFVVYTNVHVKPILEICDE